MSEKQKRSQCIWSFLGAEEDEVKWAIIGNSNVFVWENLLKAHSFKPSYTVGRNVNRCGHYGE